MLRCRGLACLKCDAGLVVSVGHKFLGLKLEHEGCMTSLGTIYIMHGGCMVPAACAFLPMLCTCSPASFLLPAAKLAAGTHRLFQLTLPACPPAGSPTLDFAPYNASDPPTATFGFFGDEVTLPQYRIERLGVEEVEAAAAAAVGSNGSSSGGSSVTLSLPEAAMESAEAAPGVNFVALKALNSIVLRAGLVPVMDACNAWMLDKVTARCHFIADKPFLLMCVLHGALAEARVDDAPDFTACCCCF